MMLLLSGRLHRKRKCNEISGTISSSGAFRFTHSLLPSRQIQFRQNFVGDLPLLQKYYLWTSTNLPHIMQAFLIYCVCRRYRHCVAFHIICVACNAVSFSYLLSLVRCFRTNIKRCKKRLANGIRYPH